jgi:exodeoxyribonuclease-1
VVPIARHPRIESRVIVCSLDQDPAAWLDLDAEGIADRLYTPAADLPEGEQRVPLKEVHTNKCPILLPLAHLRADDYTRLGIDLDASLARAATLREAPALAETVRRVFASDGAREPSDADAALYDGFAADADKRLFAKVRSATPGELAGYTTRFDDPRYRELLFRYRARNFPGSLDGDEIDRWNDYRRTRLAPGSGLSEYDFAGFHAEIATLRATIEPGPRQSWLDALEQWGRELERTLA